MITSEQKAVDLRGRFRKSRTPDQTFSNTIICGAEVSEYIERKVLEFFRAFLMQSSHPCEMRSEFFKYSFNRSCVSNLSSVSIFIKNPVTMNLEGG